MAKKVMVTEVLERGVLNYTSLTDVPRILQEWVEGYKNYRNLRLNTEMIPYDDGYHLCLVGDRPETKLERDNRLEQQKSSYLSRRRLYEQLKREFERE